jgi:hypothetical protein
VNPRTRQAALCTIGVIAILASANALAHSYAGLYDWASTHRLNAWQSLSWPAEIDVFLVIGELTLYVAYLDGWSGRHKVWPWATTVIGLTVSVLGNVGHIQPLPGEPVTIADRFTAAASPLAAFAGLTIGLMVLKMTRRLPTRKEQAPVTPAGLLLASRLLTPGPISYGSNRPGTVSALRVPASGRQEARLLKDAREILRGAQAHGDKMSQRCLAAKLRDRGHRFSNAQLSGIAGAIGLVPERHVALSL